MISRLLLATLLFLGTAWGAAGPVGAASWGWLGVRIRDLSEQEMEEISQKHGLREGFGVLIVEVLKETPAATSGLANGDLVVAVRGRPVVDTRTLPRLVAATPVGEALTLNVLRRDKGRQRVSVRVGVMPEAAAADRVAIEDSASSYAIPRRRPTGGTSRSWGAVRRPWPRSSREVRGDRRTSDRRVLVEINSRPC
jgi:membrane-associated protease RseP (regulator of RpoE activity)